MDSGYDKAEKYFECTDRERAVFEAGIKLGSIYHQYVGSPISMDNVSVLEDAIKAGAMVQPFVKNVSVTIDREQLKRRKGRYGYHTLVGEMLNVRITIQYRNTIAECGMKFVPELDYPLMFVEKLSEGDPTGMA